MDRKHWKPVRNSLIGGAIFGVVLGFGIAQGIITLVVFGLGSRAHGAIPLWIDLIIVPAFTIGTAYVVGGREYREQLESARLHSHFCKRCGYDLRGLADIVCPECGTGISDRQRRHIKNLKENPTE
jgi:hypothetical protein